MTQDANPSLINLESDTPIFRIVRLNFLINDIRSNSLTLPRVLCWDDPWEAAYFKSSLSMGTIQPEIEHLAIDWFGQCWSACPESDAMWRIYNSSNDSVRIESTAGKLCNGIANAITKHHPDIPCIAAQSIFLGKVEYHSEWQLEKKISMTRFAEVATSGEGRPWAELLLLKREAFEHEHEIRLLYNQFDYSQFESSQYLSNRSFREFMTNGEHKFFPEFIHLPFDWESAIDSVMIGPMARPDKAESIRGKLTRAASWIKNKQITQSSMYEAPKINTTF